MKELESVEIKHKEKEYYVHDLTVTVSGNGHQFTTISLSWEQATDLYAKLACFLRDNGKIS